MPREIQRGDIYYVREDKEKPNIGSEQATNRPAIIVSNNANNRFSATVEVVYLTSQRKKPLPTHVHIRGAKVASIALCEQVSSVSIKRLAEYYGRCDEREMNKIDHALKVSLGLIPVTVPPKKNERKNRVS